MLFGICLVFLYSHFRVVVAAYRNSMSLSLHCVYYYMNNNVCIGYFSHCDHQIDNKGKLRERRILWAPDLMAEFSIVLQKP